jgi:hypothetical protein
MRERGLDRRTLALVVRMLVEPHPFVPAACAKDLAGPVGRAIVDHDHLEVRRQHGPENLVDRSLDALELVVDRHQNREHLNVGSESAEAGT